MEQGDGPAKTCLPRKPEDGSAGVSANHEDGDFNDGMVAELGALVDAARETHIT